MPSSMPIRDALGRIVMKMSYWKDGVLEITVRDWGRGITDVEEARPSAVYHRRQRAQWHGFYHYGEFYGQAHCPLNAGQRHHGPDAQAYYAPFGHPMTEERLALLERAQQGDDEACRQMLTENAGLIWSIVKRYHHCGVEMDDLYQLGCIGFIKAVKGFDLTYGTQFSTMQSPRSPEKYVVSCGMTAPSKWAAPYGKRGRCSGPRGSACKTG